MQEKSRTKEHKRARHQSPSASESPRSGGQLSPLRIPDRWEGEDDGQRGLATTPTHNDQVPTSTQVDVVEDGRDGWMKSNEAVALGEDAPDALGSIFGKAEARERPDLKQIASEQVCLMDIEVRAMPCCRSSNLKLITSRE